MDHRRSVKPGRFPQKSFVVLNVMLISGLFFPFFFLEAWGGVGDALGERTGPCRGIKDQGLLQAMWEREPAVDPSSPLFPK